jgi:hypothetical protein
LTSRKQHYCKHVGVNPLLQELLPWLCERQAASSTGPGCSADASKLQQLLLLLPPILRCCCFIPFSQVPRSSWLL